MIDGAMDSENELIYVRYLDMGTGVVTSFIGIEDAKQKATLKLLML